MLDTDRTLLRLTVEEKASDGSAALRALPGLAALLGQEDVVSIIGSMPLDTLASFPGIGLDHEHLATLTSMIGRR